jgi:hypothetical protein
LPRCAILALTPLSSRRRPHSLSPPRPPCSCPSRPGRWPPPSPAAAPSSPARPRPPTRRPPAGRPWPPWPAVSSRERENERPKKKKRAVSGARGSERERAPRLGWAGPALLASPHAQCPPRFGRGSTCLVSALPPWAWSVGKKEHKASRASPALSPDPAAPSPPPPHPLASPPAPRPPSRPRPGRLFHARQRHREPLPGVHRLHRAPGVHPALPVGGQVSFGGGAKKKKRCVLAAILS